MFEKLFSERGLSLDRLRVLVEIAEAGSIAKAAGKDDLIRQSQYSRQLRELSEFFGCELARRSGKVLKLTDEGRRLAEMVREQFFRLEDFRSECAKERVEFSIGAGDSILNWVVIPALAEVEKLRKGARFRLASKRTQEVASGLLDLSLDFGVIRKDAVPAGLHTHTVGKIEYCLAVPAGLTKARMKFPEALAALPIATQTSDGQFTRKLREMSEGVGVPFAPTLSCESFTQAIAALRTGKLAAILPKVALRYSPNLAVQVLESEELNGLSRQLVLAWNPRLLQVRGSARKVQELLSKNLRVVS